MENLKKSQNSAGQSNATAKTSRKHDANLQKNSTLYFQVGLILCLLATYALFEMNFEEKLYTENYATEIDVDEEIDIKNYKVFQPEVHREEPKKKSRTLGDDPVVKENDDPIFDKEDLPIVTEPTSDTPIDPGSIDVEKPDEEFKLEVFNMNNVERIPIYPGCEYAKTNKERLKCMSEKLSRLIQRKFNTNMASELGLSGVQRIDVQFTIDSQGFITNILTRAPRVDLEKEAERVTKKIPKMQPAQQRDKAVPVIYNLPIIFQVQDY